MAYTTPNRLIREFGLESCGRRDACRDIPPFGSASLFLCPSNRSLITRRVAASICRQQPPLNLPSAPQGSSQHELISQSRDLSTSKRTADDQSPRRSDKRACTIRPKLTPANPGPAANIPEANYSGSRRPRAVKHRRGGIPANMMYTFQKEGPATLDASVPYTRSKKQCSGTFPCQNCEVSKVRCADRVTVYNQLPCFDADPNHLNIFCSMFVGTLQGLPPLPWKPKRVLPAPKLRAPELVDIFKTFAVLLSITQRRALAKLAASTRHEVDISSAALSTIFFTRTKDLLEKFRRGKACDGEREDLHGQLIVLLFLSKMWSTYVLRAAEETIVQPLFKEHTIEPATTAERPVTISSTMLSEYPPLNEAVSTLREYAHSWSRRRELLVIWTRHWLDKLYDNMDKKFLSKTQQLLELCTLISSKGGVPG
ncbi:hypothetical protein QBC43DRAFT_355471 [Cladorrhinum sp. PSN259]|nr:hypothetical protein QBC43DRAFT_355471 [Cladorrhinum sp. PSN259]